MNDRPYISFVAVGRNDDYGGDFLGRANIFIQNLVTLCEKYALPSELVLVEWNPPQNRPRLVEAISWPGIHRTHVDIRIVEVPKSIHQTLPRSDVFPVFEYIGKNVGVRRSRGAYVLVTNPDVLFSHELMRLLAARQLAPGCYYRTARYDVRTPVPVGSMHEQLEYCQRNIVRVFGYWYSSSRESLSRFDPYRRARALAGYVKWQLWNRSWINPYTSASGDFFLMHRSHWESLRGYPELKSHSFIDGYLTYAAHFGGCWLRIFHGRNVRLFHQDHTRAEHSHRPYTDLEQYRRRCRQMARQRKPIIFNDTNWGLADLLLPEMGVESAARFAEL